MKIAFPEMSATVIPNFKGGEKECAAKMFFDGKNRILLGCLEPGASIGMHTHETSSEIIYILEGAGEVRSTTAPTESVAAGECHYCPKGASHSLVNSGTAPLRFFAVVPEQ